MQYADISLIYIVNYFFRRIMDFFRHWYVSGFLRAIDWTLQIFENLDRRFAVRITAKHWMQPLYQDYTLIGYIWGFIFRTIRILFGLMVYSVIFLSAAAIFIAWAALPIFIVYQIFHNL